VVHSPLGEPGDRRPILSVAFYATAGGREPVRDWMRGLPKPDRRIVGFDIKTAQYGWPTGMPLIRKVEGGLWEVRSNFDRGIARVVFTVQDDRMVLLHGFVKKSQKTPKSELALARERLADLQKE
jgi:phage-related protein